jgi:hypothetical protein
MTHTKDEAMTLALEALKEYCEHGAIFMPITAVEAIKQALAAPVQEPVRSMSDEQDAFEKVFKLPDGITRFDGGYAPTSYSAWSAQQQCYRWEGWKARMGLATPPAAQRQWVGLTEQERNAIEDYCEMIVGKPVFEAIEAKLKEKNT